MGWYGATRSISLLGGVAGSCRRYGQRIGNILLAKTVIYLYNNALAASTTRTYRTGQKHWTAFVTRYPAIPQHPFPHQPLREFELALAFFAAHLALQPSILCGSTVAGYLSHVRSEWRRAGCAKVYLSSQFVATVTRGIHRALPSKPDSRHALLLFDCPPPQIFLTPPTPPHSLPP